MVGLAIDTGIDLNIGDDVGDWVYSRCCFDILKIFTGVIG